jgi:tetratricopeptide (TPR) repeat protein
MITSMKTRRLTSKGNMPRTVFDRPRHNVTRDAATVRDRLGSIVTGRFVAVFAAFVFTALMIIVPLWVDARVTPTAPSNELSARLENAPLVISRNCVERARAAAAGNRQQEAIGWYREAVSHHSPHGVRAAYELGYQYARAGQPDSAVIWLDTFLSHYPGDVEGHLAIAHVFSRSDKPEQALEHYRIALTLCNDQLPEAELGIARATQRKDERARELRRQIGIR